MIFAVDLSAWSMSPFRKSTVPYFVNMKIGHIFKSEAETNVRVRVRTSVVQVQSKQPIVSAIVPIAAADGNELAYAD